MGVAFRGCFPPRPRSTGVCASRLTGGKKPARACAQPQIYSKVMPNDIKEWWLKPMQLEHKTTMGAASTDPRRPKTTSVLPPLGRVRARRPLCLRERQREELHCRVSSAASESR